MCNEEHTILTYAPTHSTHDTHTHTHKPRVCTKTVLEEDGKKYFYGKSRLTVVSRAAKQSRTSDTTVCYIHERSILIERSLKACFKKIPYEKTTRVTRTTSYH